MKVKILSTKEAPSLFRRIMGQVLRGSAPKLKVKRSEVPYWQERGWKQAGRTFTGTFKTAYGSFIGMVEQIRPGNFRLFIYDPPPELRNHDHWTCFQDLGDGHFRIHMSQMPRDVSSGILTVERLLTEAFEGR
jgi:hypothetical protein